MPSAALLCPPLPPQPTLVSAYITQPWWLAVTVIVCSLPAFAYWMRWRRMRIRAQNGAPWSRWVKVWYRMAVAVFSVQLAIVAGALLPLIWIYSVWADNAYTLLQACHASFDTLDAVETIVHAQGRITESLSWLTIALLVVGSLCVGLSSLAQEKARQATITPTEQVQ